MELTPIPQHRLVNVEAVERVRARPNRREEAAGTNADGVDARLARNPIDGSPVVRFVDADTGQVVGQVPPEELLELIARLLDDIRRKEQRGDRID